MKVGDYIRTKYGIAKIKEYEVKENDDNCYYLDNNILDDDEYLGHCLYDYKYYLKQVIKSSPNIIDLIEEGDILKVNDFKDVYTIYEVEMFRNPYTNEKYLGIRNDISKRPKRLYEIPLVNLSIVTKEQFTSMEYKVGE